MKTLTEIKQQVADLHKQIEALKETLQLSFKEDLKELLQKHKGKFDEISMGINNHEFNDGDSTYFSLYYDDLTLIYTNADGESVECGGYGEESDNKEMESIREEFFELFSSYDVDNLHEEIYGGEYGTIAIQGVK